MSGESRLRRWNWGVQLLRRWFWAFGTASLRKPTVKNGMLLYGRAIENRRKSLGCFIHTEVAIGSWDWEKRLGSPKKRENFIVGAEKGMGDSSCPLLWASGGGGRARERDGKGVREDREEMEGSAVSSRKQVSGRNEKSKIGEENFRVPNLVSGAQPRSWVQVK